MFVAILKEALPSYSLCSQGPEVAAGELKVHKQDLSALKPMEAPVGFCMIVA